ncbi:MAG: transporter [bacterium]
MKSFLAKTCLVLACGVLAGAASTQAQPIVAGHYPAGVEGIKGASLPPPGMYFRDYNVFYFADTFRDGPPDFDISAYVNAPRLIWMTDQEIFGAHYGMDALVILGYMDWTAGGKSDHYSGVGDIQLEPVLLSWQFQQFDLATGYAFWVPTGDYSPTRPDLLSKGFWSHMLTLGGTWYPDKEKTWAMSLLNRYEFCHEQEKTHIDPGQVFTTEWGVSKSLRKGLDAGLIGYYQQQVTEDSGRTATSELDRKFGVGPEISAFCPKLGMFASLRYAHEFAAVERPEGHLITLTLTKPF